MTAPVAGDGTGRPSTTRRTLLRLLGCLLGATVLVLASSLAVVWGTHRTAETVRTRSLPSVMELSAVRTALVRADTAAIDSFRTGQARLAGPGEEYQNQIAAASQSLAQAAEDIGSAADTSSRQLQVVEGLLVRYNDLVGQAYAHYGKDGRDGLSTAYLWYASRLLHSADGILAQLDSLIAAETAALETRLSSGWLSPAATLVWVLPVLLLLLLLVGTQVFLRRRFRRAVNWGLATATALLAVLAAGTSFALVSKAQLADAEEELSQVRRLSGEQFSAADREGMSALDGLVTEFCPPDRGCDITSEIFRTGLGSAAPSSPAPAPTPASDRAVLEGAQEVTGQAAAATSATSGAFVVLLLASPIVLLVWWGLRPRIEEYRYRSR
ncbi:hypothetical protein [Plantactinospora endophytica]|uniref:Integral membrane protein n=1 Tax=Plantactinospora endophytica TaxID=673535 RepID=A0ABQ4DW05_9ACTN|nr:hypothetical protein [Plantactinospora endophytica]GIG86632.1 hypothetical protein Pen02_15680 [Plantactinospora endophytica]